MKKILLSIALLSIIVPFVSSAAISGRSSSFSGRSSFSSYRGSYSGSSYSRSSYSGLSSSRSIVNRSSSVRSIPSTKVNTTNSIGSTGSFGNTTVVNNHSYGGYGGSGFFSGYIWGSMMHPFGYYPGGYYNAPVYGVDGAVTYVQRPVSIVAGVISWIVAILVIITLFWVIYKIVEAINDSDYY